MEPCRTSLYFGWALLGATSRRFLRMRAASQDSSYGAFNMDWNPTTGPPWDPVLWKSVFILDSNIESFMWPSSQRESMYFTLSRSEPEKRRKVTWNSPETGFVP